MAVQGQAVARSRRESTAAKRAEVLRVASQLFYEEGYHAVGMRAIAEAANIRAASLYHHFPSKDALLFEAIQTVNRDFFRHQLPLLSAPGTYTERMTGIIRSHILYMWENKDFWWLSTREYRALSPANLKKVQVEQREYQHNLVELVRDGIAAGEFRCDDPHLTTLAMLGMINDPYRWFRPDGEYNIEEFADYYTRLAVEDLLHARPPARRRARR